MNTLAIERFKDSAKERGIMLLADIVSTAFTSKDPIGFPNRQAYSDAELSEIYPELLLLGQNNALNALKDTEKNAIWYTLMRDNPKTAAFKWRLGEDYRNKEFMNYLASPKAECLKFPHERNEAIFSLTNLGVINAKKVEGVWMPRY